MDIDLDALQQIAKKAGTFMKDTVLPTDHTAKSNHKDFVTVADIKSQKIIESELVRLFPEAIILGEEHPEEDRRRLYEPDFTGFVIDPIDGTYSFKRDMRESVISIGYIENGQPRIGVVYDPYKQEFFTADAGKGAYRNGQRLKMDNNRTLLDASVATTNSYEDAAMDRNLRRHLALYEATGHMPWLCCAGSGVQIMTNVACGRMDVYHHNGLKPWDNAAGFLIVREAGGVVHALSGGDAHFTEAAVVIGAPALVAEIESILEAYPELKQ